MKDGGLRMASRDGTRSERDTTFGDWLRAALREAGSNPAQLARHLGVTTVRLTAWMDGRERPTSEQCDRIASALGVPSRTVRAKAGLRAARVEAPTTAPPAEPTIDTATPGSAAMSPTDGRPAATNRTDDITALPPDEPGPEAAAPPVAAESPPAEPPPTELSPAESPPAAPSPAEVTAAGPEPAGQTPPRAPRRRRAAPSSAARAAVEAPPPPLLDPERIAGLRALAEELEQATRTHEELRAENERLRQECERLTEEKQRLHEQIDRVRAAVFGAGA